MMLTLPPCSEAATSMADPTTRTESITGAISSFTATDSGASESGTSAVRKPGAVMTSFAAEDEAGRLKSNAPDGPAVVWFWTPVRSTTEICAPAMGAPDGSDTTPLMVAAERIGRQASRPKTYSFISGPLPREPVYGCAKRDLAGRSPDLRLIGSVRLPIPSPEQWLCGSEPPRLQ